jgi:adenylosuccinate synthase
MDEPNKDDSTLGRIILLSGPISSGKSTLAKGLVKHCGVVIFKTRDVLKKNLEPAFWLDRKALQSEGDRLDKKTRGKWVVDEFINWRASLDEAPIEVVDSVRTPEQVKLMRQAFGARVVHVHLTAPSDELEARYKEMHPRRNEKLYSYAEAKKNLTEQRVNDLALNADIVVDTHCCIPSDVLTRTTSHPRIGGGRGQGVVDVVVGGQYGSEGKGQVVDYLSGEYDLLVRVGGPNAGHSVFRDQGSYVYHQLPSGTGRSQVRLLIGPGAVLRVPSLLQEIAECKVEAGRLAIDRNAFIISDDDIDAEKNLIKNIGSTGQGVGAAMSRRIMSRGEKKTTLAKDTPELKPYLASSLDVLAKSFSRGDKILLEGTQGTALSLYHGSYPYVTSRDTTAMGCLSETGIPPSRVRKIIMVCRTYPIRVQNPRKRSSGPLRDISYEELSRRCGLSVAEIRKTEMTSTTHKPRRIGEFDWDLLRRASLLNGPTDIALTFADYIRIENRNAVRFEQLTNATINFVLEIERVAGAPVSLITTGFSSRSVIDRRTW